MIGIKERYGMKHFISNDINLAFAYAAYYTHHAECFINGVRYRVDYFTHSIIDDTYFEYGVKFTNLKDGGISYWQLFDLKDIRKNNTLVDFHWVCFNDKSFMSVEWEEE